MIFVGMYKCQKANTYLNTVCVIALIRHALRKLKNYTLLITLATLQDAILRRGK